MCPNEQELDREVNRKIRQFGWDLHYYDFTVFKTVWVGPSFYYLIVFHKRENDYPTKA